MELGIITRKEWGAEEAKKIRPLQIPVRNVAEDHWAPLTINKVHLHTTCHTKEECTERVRLIQRMAFDQYQSDLNYSFIIGGDGNIYEGRGWTTLVTEDSWWSGIIIGYVGKYTEDIPVPDFMSAKFEEIVKYGKENGYIKDNAIIFKLNKTRTNFDDYEE